MRVFCTNDACKNLAYSFTPDHTEWYCKAEVLSFDRAVDGEHIGKVWCLSFEPKEE